MHERVAVARRPGDPAATLLPLPRFIAGFTLITIVSRAMIAGIWVAFFQERQKGSCEQAFPFGRTSVMGCFSKVLGPTPQGTWIGEPQRRD